MSKFFFGSRLAIATAVIAGLILIPFTAALAESAKSVIGGNNQATGLALSKDDSEAPTKKVTTYARGNYVWPYATGPFYGKVEQSERRAPGVLTTEVGSFRLQQGLTNFPTELKAVSKLGQVNAQYFVVQLDPAAGNRAEAENAIRANGGDVFQSMPVAAFIARMNQASYDAVSQLGGVLAVEPYHPAFKLHPTIGRSPLIDPLKAMSEVYDLELMLFEGENAEIVAQTVAQLGGNVTSVQPNIIRASIERSRLADLAKLEPVFMIFESLPITPHGEETTTTMQTGQWNNGAIPYHTAGIDGSGAGIASGQVLMTLDSGYQLDGGDLSHTRTLSGWTGSGGTNVIASHRKVILYQSTAQFGGIGDLLGCDANTQGGFSHGHLVAATALGNATAVAGSYGAGWEALDDNNVAWKLDGVAPGARLVAYDAQVTPTTLSCGDPLQDTISPGTLYNGGAGGSLGKSYTDEGAKTANFSWGSDSNAYTSNSFQIDQFLFDKLDAMVFVSAGNSSVDGDNNGIPDTGTVGTPATTKNGLAIGASGGPNDTVGNNTQESRAGFSSVGPVASSNRIAPQLMAPGQERGTMGIDTEFGCRTNDNDQLNPVECDLISGIAGTSFASPAAAGAALLVRDYYAQGFYPDGKSSNPGNAGDQIANVSGALVKATLIASADYMSGANLTRPERFNNEQGYGRIQLNQVLKLETAPASPTGIVMIDGGIPGGGGGISGLTGDVNTTGAGETDTASLIVTDADQELRVALAWLEDEGNALINDLDLTLISPSGKTYWGNYFTDDNDRDGEIDLMTGDEDCADFDGVVGDPDPNAGPWSLPVCANSIRDDENPTEAIYLSPDPDFDENTDNGQTEVGTWTVAVTGNPGGNTTAQRYALVAVGGLSIQSSVRFDDGTYVCNDLATITVAEFSEAGDLVAGLTPAEISSRVTVEVFESGNPVAVDTEAGLTFTQPDAPALKFVAENVVVTDGTARDTGNGALDVRDGDTIVVTYADENGGLPDPNKVRTSSAALDCSAAIEFGNIIFPRFGENQGFFIEGGCERNERGLFEFGFPDQYMDAGESLVFQFAFGSNESEDLQNAEVTLRCVATDANSPEDCAPGTDDCVDPDRTDNPACTEMTILNSPIEVGLIPAGAAISANFNIQMASFIDLTPEVELVLGVTAKTSGKTAAGVAVTRQTLDVDEDSVFFNTDYPTGGTEFRDVNNNELIESPTTNLGVFLEDYVFESTVYEDLTASNTKNLNLNSPWNFDNNNGGFRSGLGTPTDQSTIIDTIAFWGEDQNFNNTLDRACEGPGTDGSIGCTILSDCTNLNPAWTCEALEDRDPQNGQLDQNWSTLGGCGWQTKAPGTCSNESKRGCYTNAQCNLGGLCTGAAQATGGVWHTGRIGFTSGTCLVSGNTVGQCQSAETVSGQTGQRLWFEVLETPPIQQVASSSKVAITGWGWNMAIDLPDSNATLLWELDTDLQQLEPADLRSDLTVLNFAGGAYGAVIESGNPELGDGWAMFADLDGSQTNSVNGTVGNNRQGDNSCFFENGAVTATAAERLGFAEPEDDDLNNRYCAGFPNVACTTLGVDAACTPLSGSPSCVQDNGSIDEYVTANGPGRNFELDHFNGPDMRFSTLEDIYGETGEFFGGGIGFLATEKETSDDPDPETGFGTSIDDVYIAWREFDLIQDTTSCATGSCAAVELEQTGFFQGNGILTATVFEQSPSTNDCSLVGLAPNDLDCDNDGRDDVVVEFFSDQELDPGEFILLQESSPGSGEFTGSIPVSVSYDVPGVIYAEQVGVDNPVVNVRYIDLFDGVSGICQNDVDPDNWGRIETSTGIGLTLGDVVLVSTTLTDNGDNDGWADTNETVNMSFTLKNRSGAALTNVVARLLTNDPKIDCVINGFSLVGSMADDEIKGSTTDFVFRVKDVAGGGDRTGAGAGVNDSFKAEFSLLISADEFDTTVVPQRVNLDLDLNASIAGGTTATSFFEGFEVASGLASFTTMNLDLGQATGATDEANPQSDGYRCQYSDPEYVNSNSYGVVTDCFVGASSAQADAYFWQVHQTSAIDGGKAYSGTRSLYMGIFGPTANSHTTPMANLEAVRLQSPLNIGVGTCQTGGAPCSGDASCGGNGPCNAAIPELRFKHQINLVDGTVVNVPIGEGADRGVVMVQQAGPTGTAVGDWIKVSAYQNSYDQQGTDFLANCVFDPIDDGTNEEDFFDPADPLRRLGPSSTCKPEFTFVDSGNTFDPFNASLTGFATDGPGLEGSLGVGTWVESVFNLQQFRGKRLRLRFLNTALKGGGASTWEQIFTWNPIGQDDGWWIDDVSVSNTLSQAATLSNDNANTALPTCPSVCDVGTSVSAALVADPGVALGAPGQTLELSAITSTTDRCVGGVLQYQFLANGTVVRPWTDNPVLVVAPNFGTTYTVEVRCSANPACNDSADAMVTVTCPSSGNPIPIDPSSLFGEQIFASKDGVNTKFSWTALRNIDWISGAITLDGNGSPTGLGPDLADGTGDGLNEVSLSDAAGTNDYYLIRERVLCNQGGSWKAEDGSGAARDSIQP